MGETALNVLKHPITLGALGGAAAGGGVGYLSANKPENRFRSALVGAGTGATIGGLGGALASINVRPEELAAAQQEAHRTGLVMGKATGRREGAVSIVKNLPIDDATKQQMLQTILG